MRRLATVLLALGLAAALTAALGLGSALAQEAKKPATPTSLKLSSGPRLNEKGNPTKGQVLVSATLTGADGKALSDRRVYYTLPTELFGPREADLGRATTDSTGTAALLYLPAQGGPQTIKAYFAGDDTYAGVEASLTFELAQAEVEAPFESEPLPLSLVRQWLPISVGILVLSIWVVPFAVFWITVLGIKASARGREASRQQAATAPVRMPSARRQPME